MNSAEKFIKKWNPNLKNFIVECSKWKPI